MTALARMRDNEDDEFLVATYLEELKKAEASPLGTVAVCFV